MTQLRNQLDPYQRLDNIWHYLHPWQQKVILLNAYLSIIPRFHPAFALSLRAAISMFVLLLIMPLHPMAIPTAFGGGLAFALITD
jgi:hypothetical protein